MLLITDEQLSAIQISDIETADETGKYACIPDYHRIGRLYK